MLVSGKLERIVPNYLFRVIIRACGYDTPNEQQRRLYLKDKLAEDAQFLIPLLFLDILARDKDLWATAPGSFISRYHRAN